MAWGISAPPPRVTPTLGVALLLIADPDVKAHELWERLCRTELPRLWLPKREELHFIESIPTLGTGKVDLRAVRQLAADRATVPVV